MVSSRVGFLVVCCLLCGSAVAGAAKPSRPAAATFGTRDQLRECLDLDDAMKARAQAIATAAAATNARIAANDVEMGRLTEMKKSLVRSDKAAIDAFNQLAVAHNAHLQQVDDDAAKADTANVLLAADKADMDQKCGAFTWRPVDVEAVARERRKAATSALAAASAP